MLSTLLLVFSISFLFAEERNSKNNYNLFDATTKEIYQKIIQENPEVATLNYTVFSKAFKGFVNLKSAQMLPNDAHLITICDFSVSANEKRMWIIDLQQKKLLSNNLVSHGKNTGEEFATDFSNKLGSHQSSLGFYVTSETYEGSNGYSMRLVGMDKGLNHIALERAIVMHGAAYCSQEFINEHGRLGRSFGCPSVPLALNTQIINWIKEGTCLYIHAESEDLNASEWLLEQPNLLVVQLYNS